MNKVNVLNRIFPLILSVLFSSTAPTKLPTSFLKLHPLLLAFSSSFSVKTDHLFSMTFMIHCVHFEVSCQTPWSLIYEVKITFFLTPSSENANINWQQFKIERMISWSFCLSWTATVIRYLIISESCLSNYIDLSYQGEVICPNISEICKEIYHSCNSSNILT